MHRTRNAAYPFGYRGFESPPFQGDFFFFAQNQRKKWPTSGPLFFWGYSARLGAPSLALSLLLVAVLLALILFEFGLNLLLRVRAVGLSHVL